MEPSEGLDSTVDLLFQNLPAWMAMEHFKCQDVGQKKHNYLLASMRLDE